MNTTQPQLVPPVAMTCPECGAAMVRRWSDRFNRPFYACMRWPQCRVTHGCHPDGSPLGTPCDESTKPLRIQVHALLDPLWRTADLAGGYALPAGNERELNRALENIRQVARKRVYDWLAERMSLPREACHIAKFNADQCRRAIELLCGITYPAIRAWAKSKWEATSKPKRRRRGAKKGGAR